jgi:hypothetical protein
VFEPQLFPRGVFFGRPGGVPLGGLGIQVPAGKIDALVPSRQPGHPDLGIGKREPQQMLQTDHDVGNLHTCVVNVVLDRDHITGGPQQAYKRVAQDGIA